MRRVGRLCTKFQMADGFAHSFSVKRLQFSEVHSVVTKTLVEARKVASCDLLYYALFYCQSINDGTVSPSLKNNTFYVLMITVCC